MAELGVLALAIDVVQVCQWSDRTPRHLPALCHGSHVDGAAGGLRRITRWSRTLRMLHLKGFVPRRILARSRVRFPCARLALVINQTDQASVLVARTEHSRRAGVI
jgi:hypothetical protein